MIMINLDVMMAKRKKGLTELAGEVDITLANLSILTNNKAKAVQLPTAGSRSARRWTAVRRYPLQYMNDEEDVVKMNRKQKKLEPENSAQAAKTGPALSPSADAELQEHCPCQCSDRLYVLHDLPISEYIGDHLSPI